MRFILEMRRRTQLLIVLGVTLGVVAFLTLRNDAPLEWLHVSGTVVDAQGRPVTDAELATIWNFYEDEKEQHGQSPDAGVSLRTDTSGAFDGRVRHYLDGHVLLALDKQRERGCLVPLPRDAGEGMALRLEPLTELRCAFSHPGIERRHVYPNATLSAMPGKRYLARCSGRSFAWKLPPGSYHLEIDGETFVEVERSFEVRAGSSVIDLGTIVLERTALAMRLGKTPPPWSVTDARGVGADVQLADYAGKWVLLEFWGYW